MTPPLRLCRVTASLSRRAVSGPSRILNHQPPSLSVQKPFTTTPSSPKYNAGPLPPRAPLPPSSITISYLKGSGPGGQKINKTNSAVQIKHLPSGLVVKCQDTRSRDQNEKLAMRRLQDKLEVLEKEGTGEVSRVERRRDLLRRRKMSKLKKARRKYRALEEDDDEEDEEKEVEVEEDLGRETGTTAKDEDGGLADKDGSEKGRLAPRDGATSSESPTHSAQPSSNPG